MMATTPDRILSTMLDKLEAEDFNGKNDLQTAIKCIEITSTHINLLQTFIDSHEFNEEEEMQFFKKIKPQFDGRLIYYLRLMSIQKMVPVTGLADRIAYFKANLQKIQQFYILNNETWTYYRLNFTHLDGQYFLRNGSVNSGNDFYQIVADKKYNAPKSYTFACFHAFDLLRGYLEHQIFTNTGNSKEVNSDSTEPPLQWTASKSGLTELIYALNEMGAFNGKQDIKRIADYFSQIFNVNIGNPYKIHEDNRLRKKSRTPFLDNAILALNRRYDYDDEHAL